VLFRTFAAKVEQGLCTFVFHTKKKYTYILHSLRHLLFRLSFRAHFCDFGGFREGAHEQEGHFVRLDDETLLDRHLCDKGKTKHAL
jgi:hypothetical protein